MSSTEECPVHAVFLLAQELTGAVEDQNWQTVQELQTRLDTELKAIFSDESKVFSDQQRQELLQIYKLTLAAVQSVKSQQEKTGQEIRAFRQGKIKTKAYQAK